MIEHFFKKQRIKLRQQEKLFGQILSFACEWLKKGVSLKIVPHQLAYLPMKSRFEMSVALLFFFDQIVCCYCYFQLPKGKQSDFDRPAIVK